MTPTNPSLSLTAEQTLQMTEERHSVRAWQDKPIAEDLRAVIEEKIAQLNEASGLHIQLTGRAKEVFSATFLKLAGWKGYPAETIALVGPGTEQAAFDCGYYGEELVLFLQSIGLNTCWVGMFKKKFVDAELRDGEKIHLTIAVGYGQNPGRERPSKKAAEVCSMTPVEYDAAPDWFKAGVECALKAPTAVNQQKFLFSLNDEEATIAVSAKGPHVIADLGIVAYHFQAAADKPAKLLL